MKKVIYCLVAVLLIGCTKEDNPMTPKQDAPEGLSAIKAWTAFQLLTGGDNGDWYAVYANTDSKLDRNGMVPVSGYWNLLYGNIYGKQYNCKPVKYEREVNSDTYSGYIPLHQILQIDSYEAVKIADNNGGAEYDEIWSLTAASGNGSLVNRPGETFWVIIYQLKEGNDARRTFFVNVRTGFFKRI